MSFRYLTSDCPAVSIIVPIYNAEKYLQKCIDSVLSQTFKDWECILVDDGSPDRCGEICDEYAKNDNRFKVIHQVNGGVSSARQIGHDLANGEYTIHIDPDDWVEPTMIEELYSKARSEDSDMVICDYFQNNIAEGGGKYLCSTKTYFVDSPKSIGADDSNF